MQETYLTSDTEAIAARANEAYTNAATGYARQAARFGPSEGSPDERRQLTMLKNTITVAAPTDSKEASELARILSSMNAAYGSGKYCQAPDNCLDIEAVTKILAENRDPARLRQVWEGWHGVGAPMRNEYTRFVELSNKAAREIGFADTGLMWRSRYDMPADAFAKEVDRLWDQLRPLYLSLHAYVRSRLHKKYGDAVPAEGPIPPISSGISGRRTGPTCMTGRAGRRRTPGPARQDPERPQDRGHRDGEVSANASSRRSASSRCRRPSGIARSSSSRRIARSCAIRVHGTSTATSTCGSRCIDPTAEDFATIHHELGHNFYQRAYRTLPLILRDGANDGFHEAIGDTIALSVTPEYLVKVGLLDKAPDASGDIGLLLNRAFEKLPFLAFGRVVDQWRWRVFSGDVTPQRYNQAWWELREQYQGVRPPSPRGEQFFDPGAKYHVPANTPYARYFLSLVLQFQFHRALAKAAGCTAPLHRCSIYQSAAAGDRLSKALALGASKPWPDALEALTGERQMDASAMADYFAPLKVWLDEQNKGTKIGW